MSKVLQTAVYVSLIKKTDLLHDVIDMYSERDPNFDAAAVRRSTEESLYDDLESLAKMVDSGRGIPTTLLDHINKRTVQIRKMLND